MYIQCYRPICIFSAIIDLKYFDMTAEKKDNLSMYTSFYSFETKVVVFHHFKSQKVSFPNILY